MVELNNKIMSWSDIHMYKDICRNWHTLFLYHSTGYKFMCVKAK